MTKHFIKLLALIIVFVFAISITGCRNSKKDSTKAKVQTDSSYVDGSSIESLQDDSSSGAGNKPDSSESVTSKDDSSCVITGTTTQGNKPGVTTPYSPQQGGTSTTGGQSSPSSPSTTTQGTTPVPLTQAQINDAKRKQIEQKYSLNVKYANEVNVYYDRYQVLTNQQTIATNLAMVESCLSEYPSGFFKDIKNAGFSLSIYLIDDDPGFEGVLDKEFTDKPVLVMTNSSTFKRVFHHEMMHMIDLYMEFAAYPKDAYGGWSKYNPAGFSYQGSGTTSQYCYTYIPSPTNEYFLQQYGKTNDREDRAVLFSDMMSRAYSISCYNRGMPIRKKADAIAEAIEKYFPSVTSSTTVRWKNFLI